MAEDDSPTAVTISRNGKRVHVSASTTSSAAAQTVDLASGRITSTVTVPDLVTDLAVGSTAVSGATSAIGGTGTGTLLPFAAGATSLIGQQDIGYDPSTLALSTDGRLLYDVDGEELVSPVSIHSANLVVRRPT